MRRASTRRRSARRSATERPKRPRTRARARKRGRQTSSRAAKARALERIQLDTKEVKENGSLLRLLRKQGYEEVPLDELQDRLSKIRTALGEFIVSRRS
ncbi:MAG: hypothetical protein ACE5MM_04025 [Nitrospiraceae bacterium]